MSYPEPSDQYACLKCGASMPYDWMACPECGWKSEETWENLDDTKDIPVERFGGAWFKCAAWLLLLALGVLIVWGYF
jgi:hypothetical protein